MKTRLEMERTHWIGFSDFQVEHLHTLTKLLQGPDLARFAQNMNIDGDKLKGAVESLNDLKGALEECHRKIF